MRVCVIGAGACGLVSAKKLLDQGIEPVVFERNADLGGNWLYGAPGSAVYRSTHLISSKRQTQFRDQVADRIRRMGVPPRLFQLLARKTAEMVLGRPERFGLPKPDHAMFETHPIVHSQLYYAIGHGRVTPKPDIERLDGNRATFVDGTEEEIDAAVLATGFQLSFPFLDDRYLNLKDGMPVFYKNLFHPSLENLFFIGLIQPNSGLWFLAELQAELVARALAHPSPGLRAAVADRQDTRYFNYLPSRRHHLEVDYLRYEQDLRRLLRWTGARKEAA